MKVKIRKGTNEDLDGIYNCHKACFENIGDIWYKNIIQQYIETSYVVEKMEDNQIIAVMLQGDITPCEESDKENFEVVNKSGDIFVENNLHLESIPSITMLCVMPDYRGKGLAKKLIEIHSKNNQDDVVCLYTRKSNPAFNLYVKLGYEHIATVKNKYFQPNEDGYFMIKK